MKRTSNYIFTIRKNDAFLISLDGFIFILCVLYCLLLGIYSRGKTSWGWEYLLFCDILYYIVNLHIQDISVVFFSILL